jgi:Chitin recognition protein
MKKFIVWTGLVWLPFVTLAHNHIPSVPQVWGKHQLQQRSRMGAGVAGPQENPRPHPRRKSRSNSDGQCGSGYGACATGYCCSSSGWCGLTEDYCAAPDCQINYGPACDANKSPSGPDTSNFVREQTNPSIAYGGAGIYGCTVSLILFNNITDANLWEVPGTVAITVRIHSLLHLANRNSMMMGLQAIHRTF